MFRVARIRRFASTLAMLAGLALPAIASAAPGQVLSSQKISDTEGNFQASLSDLDEIAGATAWLGDLDGAGPAAATLAIGSAYDDDGGSNRGAVYLASLAANGTVVSHRKISDTVNFPGGPLLSGDQFGSAIAFLGDLDGAGPSAAAIAVGAVGDTAAGAESGAVYVLFLSASGTVLSWRKISDATNLPGAPLDAADEFGGAIASLGDMDGAGPSVHAIAVGAAADDDGSANAGAVYLLFLDGSANVLSWSKVSDTTNFPGAPLDPNDDFGASITSLGDLDGAGPSALAVAVGAAADDDGGSDRGAVYILFLDGGGTVLSRVKVSDTQGNFTAPFSNYDEFGGALANLGDIDGAGGGVTALMVGAAGDDDGGGDRGASHILFLDASGTCSSFQSISDITGGLPDSLYNQDGFGSSLAHLGDLDGAGPSVAAVVVGATGDDDGGVDRGAGYVLFLEGTSLVGVPYVAPPASPVRLGPAWPNPFRPTTSIPFRLHRDGDVDLGIWDLHGRHVRSLLRERMPAGDHRVVWDGRDDAGRQLPSGAYLYGMTVDGRPVPGAGKALLLR